jgi:hypothetical protein
MPTSLRGAPAFGLAFMYVAAQSELRGSPAQDFLKSGYRFSEKIMLHQ